ncbi:MAG: 4-(cytidine 5'-diphospho)-2-C-methyl-D-erythritol kinase [Pseudomonadota bacterium]
MIEEIAPAKVNLYLHVGPLRSDGLHDLASLFVFANDGDVVRVAPSNDLTVAIEGPFADSLSGEPIETNLVFKAAAALRSEAGLRAGAAITLDKRLPVAAGIGGGSADAAATLRALCRLWGRRPADAELHRLAFELGADVPACLTRAPLNVSGAGEILAPGPALPALSMCLVNPGVDMPTGPVFSRFDAADITPPPPQLFQPAPGAVVDIGALFSETRNDLETPAMEIAPLIGDVLRFLSAQQGCLGARMSGSGATCFALFEAAGDAQDCARAAQARGWWSLATSIAHREGA